jgi:hypothetical protein
MSKRWSYVAVVSLIIINGAMLGFAYQRHRLQSRLEKYQIDETPLLYRALVNEDTVKKLRQVASGQWQYLMLTFITAAHDSRLRYINNLHKRYVDRGLRVVGIYSNPQNQIESLRQGAGVDFPLILDDEFQLHRAFHIHPAHTHGGLTVVDNQGRIDFYTQRIPVKDQLRQLAEKYALGQINYTPSQNPLAAHFKVGAPIPDLFLTSLDGDDHLVLDATHAANLALVIFTASCSSCQLKQFVNDIPLVQASLASDSRYRRHSLIVLFGPNFDRALLASYQRSGALPPSTYVLGEDRLDDEYNTRFETSTTQPLVVLTGASGKITAVSSLPLNGGTGL